MKYSRFSFFQFYAIIGLEKMRKENINEIHIKWQ